MIYLFHGQNTSESRQALLELKSKYDPSAIAVLDGKKLNKDELVKAVESRSIFSPRTLVVVEKIPDLRRAGFLTEILENLPESADVAFWSDEELKATHSLVKTVAKTKGRLFHFREKIPKNIFPFLDALGNKKKEQAFIELHRLLDEGNSPIYLHTMIAYQIRNLLRVKLGDERGIHPFVARTTRNQVKNFEEEELIEIHKMLFETDLALKTGKEDSVLVLDRLVNRICS